MAKEQIPDGEGLKAIRDYTVLGLSESVPEIINFAQAEEILCLWFPGDTFALEALYRKLSERTRG